MVESDHRASSTPCEGHSVRAVLVSPSGQCSISEMTMDPFSGSHLRIIILLIDHIDNWPSRKVHIVIRSLQAYRVVSESARPGLGHSSLPSSRRAFPDFLPTIVSRLLNNELATCFDVIRGVCGGCGSKL